MKNEIIITAFSNVNKEGITLHTNIPAKLKTGNVKGKSVRVSWDKIGSVLFQDYTDKTEVSYLNELRKRS